MTITAPPIEPVVRTSGGWELFALVAAAQLVASMQFSMIGIALPNIVDDLDTSLRWASWSISLFTMAQAVSLPMLGKLSDTLGRRAVFVGGLTLFGVSSLACAAAPNVGGLIAARAFQGIAAGSMLPSAYGIVGDSFAGANRTRVLGLLSSVFPIGAIIGPNVGGLLVEHTGWRGTFLVNVPLAAAAAVWGWRRLPRPVRRGPREPIDHVGAALLSISVGALMIAVTELGRADGSSRLALVVGGVAIAIGVGIAFLSHEQRCPYPLVDIELLRRRDFAFLNALNFLYGVCIFGMVSFVPLYAQEGYGFSAAEAGVLLAPRAIAMMLTSILASMIIHRTGFRRPIGVGMIVMAASGLLLSAGPGVADRAGLGPFMYLTTIVALLGLGLGFAGPSANQAGIDLLPDQLAAVTGLRGMFRALGGALGTAAIASIASRSPSNAVGLERSFALIALVSLVTVMFLRGIPDRPRSTEALVEQVDPPLTM